jgi:hypothetical protein
MKKLSNEIALGIIKAVFILSALAFFIWILVISFESNADATLRGFSGTVVILIVVQVIYKFMEIYFIRSKNVITGKYYSFSIRYSMLSSMLFFVFLFMHLSVDAFHLTTTIFLSIAVLLFLISMGLGAFAFFLGNAEPSNE